MNSEELYKKFLEIKTKYENKDDPMWECKSEVFDFYSDGFEFLVSLLSGKFDRFDSFNHSIILDKVKLNKAIDPILRNELDILIGTLALRFNMLNTITSEAIATVGQMEGFIEKVASQPCEEENSIECMCLTCEAREILLDD